MRVVDSWNLFRLVHSKSRKPLILLQFVDQLVWEMIEMENKQESQREAALTLVTLGLSSAGSSTDRSEISTITSLSNSGTRTKERSKKQLRCIWCSIVNLMDRKTHIFRLECGRGFS